MRFGKLDAAPFPIEASDENIALAKEFLLQKWIERHEELKIDRPAPTDLSNSCKFSALFSSVVFGGDIAGNYDHVFTLIDDEVLDLNEDAVDVAELPDPHKEDDAFIYSEDFDYSIRTCIPRVQNWIAEFSVLLEATTSLKF
jgi:hypothetical protein